MGRFMLPALSLSLIAGCASRNQDLATPPTSTVEQAEMVPHSWLDVPYTFVSAGSTRLAVLDTGGDGPPILLVHGLGSTSSFWQHQLTGQLTADYRLLAPDLPGWGRSDQPDGAYSPSWYAEHLVGLMDVLQIPKATVVGHSMGGQAAIALALANPERVERLILSAPAGVETFTEPEAALLGNFWTEEKLRQRTPAQARAAFGFVFATWDEHTQRLLDERLAVDGTERFPGLARAVMRSVDGMLAEPVFDRLDQIQAPTLYIYGSSDAMIPNAGLHPQLSQDDIAARARERIPDLTVVRLEGAGHTPHHDQPMNFDAAVGAFLRGE
ncbi:MAG: alpha/beta hydrolase [Myxococcota bacterium]